MKKIIAGSLVVLFMIASVAPTQAVESTAPGRGGIVGFFAGCCFGVRAGGDYNSGKSIHWREWGLIVPVAGFFIMIWNGVDGASGITREAYVEQYGSTFY